MIRVLGLELFRCELHTRLPFRYGIVTMTALPHVFLRAWVELDGRTGKGLAADNLPPKWFTKNAETPIAEEIGVMLAVITRAAEGAISTTGVTLFDWWRTLFARQQAWADVHRIPPLLAHFGTALVERAVQDACCRLLGQPWHALLRSDAFGMDWSTWEPRLAGEPWRELLPPAPLSSVTVRHTVGMADPLRESDVSHPCHDGLPDSLEAAIARHHLNQFKLKLSGDLQADLARLRATAGVITAGCSSGFGFSLDANEQFDSPAGLRSFGDAVMEDPALRSFFEHLSFIEQPLARSVALAPGQTDIRPAWPARIPIIIDESDGGQGDLPRALELGYSGVSHKNCKGLFKSLRNALLVAHHRHHNPTDREWMTSGEDLANIGPVALLQDLAVQAALGNANVERNGHHYFAGLSAFPGNLSAASSCLHPDLYQPDPLLGATLRIAGGELNLGSVNAAPLGCALPSDSPLPGDIHFALGEACLFDSP